MKKILTTLSVVIVAMTFVTKVSAATPNNPVGWWKLDETEGTTVNDSSSYDNDGTTYGDPEWVSGIHSGALKMDGEYDYVSIPSDPVFNFTERFKVEAWVNPSTLDSTYYDLVVFRGYNKWAFGIIHGNKLMFGENGWSGYFSHQIYSDPVTLETNNWYHIAVVYDVVNKSADFYLNGVSVGSGKQSTDKAGIVNSGNITFGYDVHPYAVGFNGIVDDVKIWNMGMNAGNSMQCTTIQSNELLDSMGDVITTGIDSWGYNYQGRVFEGNYCDAYRKADWCQPYIEDHLVMKWNDAWLSNRDCDGDGKLDRHYGYDSYIGSGAWLTNTQNGSYINESNSELCHWSYFTKIVAVPPDAHLTDNVWYTPENTVIGPSIWGEFAIIQEESTDSCFNSDTNPTVGHFHDISEEPIGFGFWDNN